MCRFHDLEEAKRIIEVAKHAYDLDPSVPQPEIPSHIGEEPVTVICTADRNIVNCGLKEHWTFTGDQEALKKWWLGLEDAGGGTYSFKSAERKLRGGWQVNLLFHRWRQRVFNFHLDVPAKED